MRSHILAAIGLCIGCAIQPVIAGEGKIEGIGPLKLGISVDDISRQFGPPKEPVKTGETVRYESKIKFLGRTFDLVIFLKAGQAVRYSLIDRDPMPVTHQAPCARLAANIKARLTREYVGIPDFSSPPANLTLLGVPLGEGTSTTWLFDNGRVEFENAFWENQCKVILSISRVEPDDYKMSILP